MKKQKNKNIIWKEVDKRSVIVILNKTYYRTKTQEILKDVTKYKITDTNVHANILSKLTKFGKTHNEALIKKEKRHLH